MSLLKFIKKNRPSVSLGILKQLGLPGMVNSLDADLGFETFLKKMALAAGINHIVQINDCEDSGDWAESADGVFDMAVGTTGHRVGSKCLKLTQTSATDNSQYISTVYINESNVVPKRHGKKSMDWTDTKYLGFWVDNDSGNTGDNSVAGEVKVAIVSNGVLQDKVNVQAIVDDVHQWFQIDMVAEGWDLTGVEELRFYSANTNTGEILYVDDILRYEISYNDAPLYGCAFPIKSGSTINNGDNVRWTIDGLTAGDGSEVVNDLGMGEVFASSLVGTAKRDKWVMIPGIQIFIARMSASTTAGEGLIFSGATTMEGVGSGVEEKAVAKGLEVAGATSDDIFCVRGLGNIDMI